MQLLDNPPSKPFSLAAGHCMLFTYGQLQPGLHEPASVSHAWPDRVRGLLYDLGEYPAAIQIGLVERWFHGFVLEIAESELTDELDQFEDVEKGIYRRVTAFTESGFEVWVYGYARPLPPGAFGPIDRWRGPRQHSRSQLPGTGPR